MSFFKNKNCFKNKNVLIVGLKKSGLGAIELLTKNKAFCYGYDDDKELLKQVISTNVLIGAIDSINDDTLKIMDYMVISPSISIFSEYVKLAKLQGVKVISELELASYFARGNIVAITGTNGKTTTSSLIYSIIKNSHKSCVLCGNIGEPFSQNLLPFKTNYIVEMSSFQLESLIDIKPNIAVITNITPNHLDRHFTLKNYAEAKFNIFKNMTKKDLLILNADDEILFKLKDRKTVCKILWISLNKKIDGYFVFDNKIFYRDKKKEQMIISIDNIKLLGKHNLYNILCAVAVCRNLKISADILQQSVDNFLPLEHRLQFVKSVNGVDYINDSKSTSPNSTITAIDCFKKKPLILILGGSEKNANFDVLISKIAKSKNIKFVIVNGATTKRIVKSLKKYKVNNFFVADGFSDALELATKNAKFGDTVLLSPSCASFDYFKCYEERGENFVKYVEGIKKIETEN